MVEEENNPLPSIVLLSRLHEKDEPVFRAVVDKSWLALKFDHEKEDYDGK